MNLHIVKDISSRCIICGSSDFRVYRTILSRLNEIPDGLVRGNFVEVTILQCAKCGLLYRGGESEITQIYEQSINLAQSISKISNDYSSVYTFDEAKKLMFNSVLNRQAGEMRKEVISITKRNDNIEEQDVFYIHFPVYEYKFSYNNKKYEAFIDGSSGRVIHIDVPISTKFRLTTILTGISHAVIGIGLFIAGISVPAITFFGVTAGLGIFGTGIVFLAMNFRKGAQEKQT